MPTVTFQINTSTERARKVLSFLFSVENGDDIKITDCPDHNFIRIVKGMKKMKIEDVATKYDQRRMLRFQQNMDESLDHHQVDY